MGLAEKIIRDFVHDKNFVNVIFPMIYDAEKRDKVILEQLMGLKQELLTAQNIFFPVIGDCMLYSTAKYFLDALRKITPDFETEFIPGISAHSLAASTAKKFLAMNDDIFSVIPGTANPEKIINALRVCDAAAVYKPSALTDPEKLFAGFDVVRVDYAGIPELERVIAGHEALENLNDYLSIILLWRN